MTARLVSIVFAVIPVSAALAQSPDPYGQYVRSQYGQAGVPAYGQPATPAQATQPVQPQGPTVYPPPGTAAPIVMLAPAQLDQLLASVALYPDPLLATVLTASMSPEEVASADGWLRSIYPQFPPDAWIAAQPWQEGVKALIRTPAALNFLARNPQYTAALGNAYRYQPGEVFLSVQRLRMQAHFAGNLTSTSTQTVAFDGGSIRILPTDPYAIAVPVYDPAVVYVRRPVVVYQPPVVVYRPPPVVVRPVPPPPECGPVLHIDWTFRRIERPSHPPRFVPPPPSWGSPGRPSWRDRDDDRHERPAPRQEPPRWSPPRDRDDDRSDRGRGTDWGGNPGSDRGDRGGSDRGDRGGADRGDRGDRGGSDRGDRGGVDRPPTPPAQDRNDARDRDEERRRGRGTRTPIS